MSRRAQIEELLQATPNDVFLNYAYAMELTKTGDVAAARQAYAHVRQLDPDYVPAYFQEGQMLSQADQHQAARAILLAGISVARKVNDAHAVAEMTEFLETL